MIKMMNLLEVAELEYRPQQGKIYPAGTIIIQISATKGQVLYLRDEKEIESKYAVISPKINAFYLFVVIKKFFPAFFESRKEGLNFKAVDLEQFNVKIHQDRTKQQLISSIMKKLCSAEDFY